MKVWLLPIEPLESRYSEQWLRWFPRELERAGCDVVSVMGLQAREQIEHGEFLDVYDTNYFKATQLSAFVCLLRKGEIKDGDWVLLLDGWNPCIEQLAYMRDLGNIKFKIDSCFHAGSYDPWDLLGQNVAVEKWAQHAERAYVRASNLIFVATRSHANMLGAARGCAAKIWVTGFPLYPDEWMEYARPWGDRTRCVVFPHRLAPEKAPWNFDKLRDLYQETYPDDRTIWIRSKEACISKIDYYTLLGSARVAVSTAFQETWGIAMLEAASLGCHPVVPDRLSYSELYHRKYLTREEAVAQIKEGLDASEPYQYQGARWLAAIENMVKQMGAT